MMKKSIAVLLASLAASPAWAGSATVNYNSTGASPFATTTDGGGNNYSRQTIWDYSAAANGAAVDVSHGLLVDPGSAALWNTTWAGGVLGAMANYGTSPGAVLVPGVNASVTASALPTGAATSALQTTGNTALTTINTTLGTPFQAGGSLAANQSVNVSQFGGTSTATGQVAVSVAPVTSTNTALVVDLRPDSPGIITIGTAGAPSAQVVSVQGVSGGTAEPISAASLPLPTGASTSALQPTNAAQSSVTAGQTGYLVEGAVTTGAPSFTTGQTNPLSLDTAGNLRVNVVAGGSGGGAVTIVNGGNVVEGSTTDTPCTAPATATACTLDAVLKAALNGVTGPIPPQSPAVPIGGVGICDGANGTTNPCTTAVTVKPVSTAPVTSTDKAMVVDLRPDSPGIIALGGATPANSVPTVPSGYTYTHISTDTTTTAKSGAGVLHTICVNTVGAGATITVDDATSATTPNIAILSGATLGCYTYDVAFNTGLTIVTAVTAPDITVSWR
jgi:hypothetical protein